MNAEAQSVKVGILVHKRKWDEALALARGAVFRNADAPILRRALGWALLANGDYEPARAEFQTYTDLAPRRTVPENLNLVTAYLALDELGLALDLLNEIEAAGVENQRTGWFFAEAHARLGNTDTAAEYMNAALQGWPAGNLMWYVPVNDFYRDPAIFQRFWDAMRAAGLPVWPFDYDRTHAENRLGNAALRKLFEPGFQTISSTDALGGKLEMEFRKDGTFTSDLSFLPFDFSGTWRIVDDAVCLTVPDLYKGRETCEQVYRDPERPAWRYVQLTSFGLRRLGVSRNQDGPDR